jgi:hypothetical protein
MRITGRRAKIGIGRRTRSGTSIRITGSEVKIDEGGARSGVALVILV